MIRKYIEHKTGKLLDEVDLLPCIMFPFINDRFVIEGKSWRVIGVQTHKVTGGDFEAVHLQDWSEQSPFEFKGRVDNV